MDIQKQTVAGNPTAVGKKVSLPDRLVIGIERLRWPAWLSYIGLILAGELLFDLTFWIDGSVPFGKRVVLQSVSIPLIVLSLAFYHFLTRIGKQALQAFRPLLAADEDEIAQIDHELNELPSWANRVILPLAIAGSIWYVFGAPNTFGAIVPRTVLPAVVVFIISIITVLPFYGLLIRIIRQMRILPGLFQRAVNLNLLHLEPAHAFARLTASTGGGLIFLMIVSGLYNPELGAGFNLFASLTAVGLSVLLFIVPLIGMRNRLVREKLAHLKTVSDLLQMTLDQLHDSIRNQNYAETAQATATMHTLIEERELIEKVSTWPWNTGTIRGFASTLILPVVIWIITRVLERYL